jgi:predicted membrane protein
MTSATKEKMLWVFLSLTLIVTVPLSIAVILAVPGITFYKLKHGADSLVSYSILSGYVLIWAVFVALHLRFRKQDKLWAIVFGICFYVLLFWSWKL